MGWKTTSDSLEEKSATRRESRGVGYSVNGEYTQTGIQHREVVITTYKRTGLRLSAARTYRDGLLVADDSRKPEILLSSHAADSSGSCSYALRWSDTTYGSWA